MLSFNIFIKLKFSLFVDTITNYIIIFCYNMDMKDFLEEKPIKFCILRHDVDRDLSAALDMARIENSKNLKAASSPGHWSPFSWRFRFKCGWPTRSGGRKPLAGPGGDAGRSMGYIWSKEGTETLYLRSKAVLDARAAGIQYPTVSSWWDIKDTEGLRKDALLNRSLGFRGQTVMHPTHVPIVNEVFTPSAGEIAFFKGLIETFEEAEKKGSAAVVYQGDMIDYAMVKTAREMLAFAESIDVKVS